MKANKSKTNIFMFLKRQSPTILSVISAGGVVGTAVLAVKATPKAMKILEDRKRENGELHVLILYAKRGNAIFLQ